MDGLSITKIISMSLKLKCRLNTFVMLKKHDMQDMEYFSKVTHDVYVVKSEMFSTLCMIPWCSLLIILGILLHSMCQAFSNS